MIITDFLKQKAKGVPWAIILIVYIILAFGLVNLYSATVTDGSLYRFYNQIKWIIAGSCLMVFFGWVISLKAIEQLAFPAYFLVCVLLVLVALFGSHAKGAERWLIIGPLKVQPSEFVKIIIILALAKSFTLLKEYKDFSLFSLWRQIIIISIPFILVLIQPDLGTAGLILLISSMQMFIVKINWKSIIICVLIGLTVALLSWNFFLYDYQKQRVLNFLNPMLDPRGTGYHSIQSMIAVGSGGLFGLGFKQGLQSKLQFLPERHTDFIFSVLAEEHGFLGCMLLFVLFLVLISRIMSISSDTKDTFSCLASMGIAAFLLLHFLINVAMVLGLLPVVGVPLSLVSYGGSHMLSTLSCIGIIIAIERKRHNSNY